METAAAGGNVISPDGRTLTHVDATAGVTNITTGTVRNGTGFNSFSQFQVGTGNTVNLHVPDTANKLLNIVRDGPVFVDGILNGYKTDRSAAIFISPIRTASSSDRTARSMSVH